MAVINALRLTDFRSYASLDLLLDGRPVVLYGSNGAGKTNLMEAVSLLSPGRGLRRAKPAALARSFDGDIAAAWGVVASITAAGREETVKIAVGQVPEYPRRRSLRIEGKAATGVQMAALMPMMWLTPEHDRLFTGPASDRRKFLDRFCLAFAASHGTHYLRYEKARAERNRLLADNITDAAWYDALEADMAHYGARVAQARAHTLALLKAEIEARPEGAFPKAVIALEGEAEQQFESYESSALGEEGKLESVQAFIAAQLKDERRNDMAAGRTLRGVHRSDLRVHHGPKNMPAESCSTGEQKALLIGLVLAQARAQADKRPILLLDEVAAHLDEIRRAAMIEELLALGLQTFLTGTDAELFSAFAGRAQSFHVNNAILTPIEG